MKSNHRLHLLTLAALFIIHHSPFVIAQGPLTPPGAPGPTMKTLDQLEPRIIVNATNTPGNATNVFRITAPGSYYLTGNVAVVAGKSGIEINSHNVTIDLNGFTLQGAGSGFGIKTPDVDYDHIVIRNGFIKGFLVDGINLVGDGRADGTLIEGVHCSNNGGHGFSVGGAVLRACTATFNGGHGIYVSRGGCTITDCQGSSNGDIGIFAQDGSTATGCVAEFNGGDGFQISNATLKSSAARGNNGNGIFAVDAVVSECSSIENQVSGIRASSRARIVGNVITKNVGAGINVISVNGMLEDNLISQNAVGLDVDGINNVIRNNTVFANPDNYAIVAGNQVEVLLSQVPEMIDFAAKVVLAGDLTGTGGIGIFINSDNVTIDLAGHALIGAGGSDGISVNGSRSNISVRNGTVRNWGSDGIDASVATGGQFSDLIVHNNGGVGLKVGSRAQVSHVISRANSSSGITTSTISVVADCTSDGNGSVGISANTGSTIERCVVSTNTGDGINVFASCLVLNNACSLNGNGAGNGAGIHATSVDNRIEGNNCIGADRGIDVDVAGNIIVRNTCSGNTNNWDVVAGNVILVINATTAAAVTGNSGGTAPGSSDPSANFTY